MLYLSAYCSGCVFTVCVCSLLCVCTLDGLNARAQILSMGHHTWPYVTSLSLSLEVDSSIFVSERISGIRCRKLRHYSIIPFLLSLSAYNELTEIKMFTGINIAQSLHVCKCVLV